MKKDASYPVNNDETLYLIGFRQILDSDTVDLYTLMTFGGDENRPIMVDDNVLFFNEPELAFAALDVANPDMKSFGSCPEEVAAIYNISEMLQLIETANIDETATIVDCLNVFDDLLEAVKQPLPPDYKRILYAFADHLTFHREFGTFLEEQHIDRAALREAIEWCIETIFSRSKFLSLQNWEQESRRNIPKTKNKTKTVRKKRTSKRQKVAPTL